MAGIDAKLSNMYDNMNNINTGMADIHSSMNGMTGTSNNSENNNTVPADFSLALSGIDAKMKSMKDNMNNIGNKMTSVSTNIT